MTFKEKLIEKAKQINIQKEMEAVKQGMEECFSYREFHIRLYKTRGNLIIGSNYGIGDRNYASFFVPKNISPAEYINLFIKAFKELGFSSNDITLDEKPGKDYELYTIIVRW